jgi:hypothetical protein
MTSPRLTFLIAFLLFIPFVSAYGQEETNNRFGKLVIKTDETDNLKHKLLFKGNQILEYMGESLKIEETLTGNDRDFVIVVENSGGIACPSQIVIVELDKTGVVKTSKEFGTCLPPEVVRLVNHRVVIEMFPYYPHPELIPRKQLREAERTKEIFIWYQGRLSKKVAPRNQRSS